MKREDILHLSELSRIALTDEEVEKLSAEIEAILGYVSTVSEAVSSGGLKKSVGPVFNVFREDEVTNEPGLYTEALIAAMPDHDGTYLKVKKILNPDA